METNKYPYPMEYIFLKPEGSWIYRPETQRLWNLFWNPEVLGYILLKPHKFLDVDELFCVLG